MTTGQNNEKTVHLGEEFDLAFESIPSAGYVWNVASLPQGIQLVNSTQDADDQAVGGEVKEIFTFKPVEKGNFSIAFEYKRVWEQTPFQSKEFVIHVE